MRVMLVALAPSHLVRMAATAWALRSAGHEVVVAGRLQVAEAARQVGLCGLAVPELPLDRLPPPAERPAAPVPAFTRLSAGLTEEQRQASTARERQAERHPWEQRVRRVLDGYLEAGRRWRPDLLLCDPIEFAGAVVAGVLKVPLVLHRWGSPDSLTSEAVQRAGTVLAPLCAEHGLDDGPRTADLVLDPCPPSLQLPAADPALPMRFVSCNGSDLLPDWARRPSRGGRVYVAFGMFGTEAAQRGADFIRPGDLADRYREVAEALAARSGAESVVSVPGELRDALRGLPPRIRCVDWIPLNAVLAPQDVVVHHGGVGTAMTACARGAVQLVLPPGHPVFLECAAGLAARGVARSVDADALANRPGALADALEDVLSAPGLRPAAADLAAEIASLPAPAAVVRELERL
ncbi:nucleotide disphospho-sugar-binding domain-containing protein [Streptomyces sp. NPDC048417]|uniref:nucleotide disphospho-sugar-binding domain-containing protein n=1 Tax=Streptomyces sp. NPDC048417 TaxID=3155387 RepID=UPI003444E988